MLSIVPGTTKKTVQLKLLGKNFLWVKCFKAVTYHYADKTCLFNRCHGCMMYKSEKYKAYKLDEARDDGAEWIRKTLGLAKADHVNACGV